MKRWRFGLRGMALLFAAIALLLCVAGGYMASASPDGLEKIAFQLGFADRTGLVHASPVAKYEFPFLRSAASRKVLAGVIGAAACFLAVLVIGKYSSRRSDSVAPGSARPLE